MAFYNQKSFANKIKNHSVGQRSGRFWQKVNKLKILQAQWNGNPKNRKRPTSAKAKYKTDRNGLKQFYHDALENKTAYN